MTILLSILLALCIAMHFSLHKNSHVNYQSQATIEWLQPSALYGSFPNRISNSNWHLEFHKIEQVLWKMKFDASGVLNINAETIKILDQVYAQLSNEIGSSDGQRMALLIEKSHTSNNGKLAANRLTKLINSYALYQQDYKSSLAAINVAQDDQKLILLKRSTSNNRQRQERYFGADVATKLFSDKNLTTDYLTQRRIIILDTSLNEAQKAEQLSALQVAHKNARSD